MDTITLADGTVIENAYARTSLGKLWYYIEGMNIRDVFALMSDSEKTATITDSSTGSIFTGYTNIYSIQRNETLISGGIDHE